MATGRIVASNLVLMVESMLYVLPSWGLADFRINWIHVANKARRYFWNITSTETWHKVKIKKLTNQNNAKKVHHLRPNKMRFEDIAHGLVSEWCFNLDLYHPPKTRVLVTRVLQLEVVPSGNCVGCWGHALSGYPVSSISWFLLTGHEGSSFNPLGILTMMYLHIILLKTYGTN